MSPRILATVLAGAVAAAPATARAETEEFYGHELLIGDGAGWLTAIVGTSLDSDPVVILGLATVAAGGPIAHLYHGNPASAGISLGLRLGLPVGGYLLGDALCTPKEGEWFGCFGQTIGLGLLGYLGAVVIDVAVLGYDKSPAASRRDAQATPRMFSFGGRF